MIDIEVQPNPPPLRRNDDLPGGKRGDDVKIVLPFGWGSIEGNGRIIMLIIAAVLMPIITVGAIIYGINRLSGEHTTLVRAVYLNTYVMSLTEAQRQALDLREPEEIRRMRRERER